MRCGGSTPDAVGEDQSARALLDCVIAAQAELVAQWMSIGFIHGVMNTDNCSISGETIDYGPCAFMDEYHSGRVYSSIDHGGRYAYGNQPGIAHWNLARLAQALLPVLGNDEDTAIASAQEAIDAYPAKFEAAYLSRFCAKLGLAHTEEDDLELNQNFLSALQDAGADFTNSFRSLAGYTLGARSGKNDEAAPQKLPGAFHPSALEDWLARWHARLGRESAGSGDIMTRMNAVNPAFIPRNHRVEEALDAAVFQG
jgi:uncharacterized protein YdiU (UPF0061 family)